MFELERQIGIWKSHFRGKGSLLEADLEELEGHLRDEIGALQQKGLSEEEAFLIGVRRLGVSDAVAEEFGKVNTEKLWKQLVLVPLSPEARARRRTEQVIVAGLALLAGTLAKIPGLFGLSLESQGAGSLLYLKNVSLLLFPAVAAYFAWRRGVDARKAAVLFALFVLAALVVNLYPLREPYHTATLTAIHLPIVLWLFVGIAYTASGWRDPARRMDFVRFSGETFLYGVLIACGGFVLVMFVAEIFRAIGVDVTGFGRDWIALYGIMAIPVVAAYLADAKSNVVENLAPVLARIFSPLFLLAMVAFLAAMVVLGKSPYSEREFLIGFDVMLALVLGLVLYILSAREEAQPPQFSDWLNLALIVVALVIDAVALSAIVFRISEFGFSANKTAALGENVVLFANLLGLAVLYVRFLARKAAFADLAGWQTAYLPVYSAWAAVVVLLFPPLFRWA